MYSMRSWIGGYAMMRDKPQGGAHAHQEFLACGLQLLPWGALEFYSMGSRVRNISFPLGGELREEACATMMQLTTPPCFGMVTISSQSYYTVCPSANRTVTGEATCILSRDTVPAVHLHMLTWGLVSDGLCLYILADFPIARWTVLGDRRRLLLQRSFSTGQCD